MNVGSIGQGGRASFEMCNTACSSSELLVGGMPPCARRPTTDDGDIAPNRHPQVAANGGQCTSSFSKIQRSGSDRSIGSGSLWEDAATESTASLSQGSLSSNGNASSCAMLIVDKVPQSTDKVSQQRRRTLQRSNSLQDGSRKQQQSLPSLFTKKPVERSTSSSSKSASTSLFGLGSRRGGQPRKATSLRSLLSPSSTTTSNTVSTFEHGQSADSAQTPRRRGGRPQKATSLQHPSRTRMSIAARGEEDEEIEESPSRPRKGPPLSASAGTRRRGGKPQKGSSLSSSFRKGASRRRSDSCSNKDEHGGQDTLEHSSSHCSTTNRGNRSTLQRSSSHRGTLERSSSHRSRGGVERSLSGQLAGWAKRSASKIMTTQSQINKEWNDVDEGFNSLLCD